MKGLKASIEWYRRFSESDVEFLVEEAKIDFAVALERMMSRNRIKKADLAKKLGTSAPYVTKVLRGDANFTIETMVKLAHAAGGKYCHDIVRQNEDVQWVSVVNESAARASDSALNARKEGGRRVWLEAVPHPVPIGNIGVDDERARSEAATVAA